MITKVIEIRDRATYVPVIATLMASENPAERYHLRRSGFDTNPANALVMVTRLNDSLSAYSQYEWDRNSRTMQLAHEYIQENFDTIDSGDVVDVEFIEGETDTPKESERSSW